MAVLNFTPADALQTVTVQAGNYKSMITKIDGPKASSSGKSNNFIVTIEIIEEGKYKGKQKDLMFNSAVNNMSILGTMQMYPTNEFLAINAAVNKTKVEVANVQVDTDNLLNKPFDATWGVITVDGKLENTILAFLPEGQGEVAF